ncbi:MAG TPA: hypothetical protein DCM28_20115 [Phycisphaerales bacterium]|nr:hypothetical protein [Phycisphaerales bacterium]HCD31855.1 hypothetical protein [Phycisphaerales bacterium]
MNRHLIGCICLSGSLMNSPTCASTASSHIPSTLPTFPGRWTYRKSHERYTSNKNRCIIPIRLSNAGNSLARLCNTSKHATSKWSSSMGMAISAE